MNVPSLANESIFYISEILYLKELFNELLGWDLLSFFNLSLRMRIVHLDDMVLEDIIQVKLLIVKGSFLVCII